MTGYIIRRLLSSVPVLLIVSLCVFSLTNLLPGDPVEALLGEEVATTPEVEERLREDLGLNDPLPVQYFNWLRDALSGELGTSIQSKQTVLDALGDRLPVTLQLALVAWCIGVGISIPLGIVAALNRNSWIDQLATVLALSGVAVPAFWMGLMFILIFAVWLNVLPPSGFVNLWDDPADAIKHLALPAITLGVHQTGTLTRQTRSAMLEVLGQDYVRTARSKGLREKRVVLTHALRNAMLPILTVLGIQAGALVGGTVVVEQVFAIPGMGRLAVSAVFAQDIPVIQGVVLVAASSVLLANLLTDLAYGLLDPRIRYGRS
jgi:peptide/nickel transport system permease protein